ncbi:MAG: hypothetical protein RLY86_1264 [Pseudomonadota bacterium]
MTTPPAPPVRVVSPAGLEACLATVVAGAPADPAMGLFDPDSRFRRVNREAVVFIGAARALLLQLAHPWVAAGVAAHSVALTDPLGRFHRTFGHVHPMVFGDRDQALDAARRLHRRHAAVTGRLPGPGGGGAAGGGYMANRTDALAWVQATLADTALLVHEMVLPPLAPADRDAYWRDSRRFGLLFGIPLEGQPADWAGFQDLCRGLWGEAPPPVTPAARHVADSLFRGGPPWLRLPRWYLDLTATLLPPDLATGFGLDTGPAARRRADRALRVLRATYPRLPTALRHVGPAREAAGRLRGRAGPDPWTKALNRLWIGRPAL